MARHQDVRPFLDGEGFFEAYVCIEGSMDGAINIWFQDPLYGPPEFDARRRLNLAMVAKGEAFTSSCRRKWFHADDLGSPSICPGSATVDAGHCGPSSGAAGAPAGPTDTDTEPPDAGAELRFDDTQVQLVAEWCDPNQLSSASDKIVVTLVSLKYFPPSCFCSDDGSCSGRGFCLHDYWTDNSCCTCNAECPGVCSSDLNPEG